jgi:hypothetical protein
VLTSASAALLMTNGCSHCTCTATQIEREIGKPIGMVSILYNAPSHLRVSIGDFWLAPNYTAGKHHFTAFRLQETCITSQQYTLLVCLRKHRGHSRWRIRRTLLLAGKYASCVARSMGASMLMMCAYI